MESGDVPKEKYPYSQKKVVEQVSPTTGTSLFTEPGPRSPEMAKT